MAYLYRHIRLDKNEVFYIGIGTTDDNHKRAYDTVQRSDFWKRITSKSDYRVEIVIDDLTDEEVFKKEREFISIYGRKDLNKGTLCNLSDGGEGNKGWIPSDEWRKAHSEARKGLKMSDEWRAKLSKAKKGISRPMSEAAKEKIRIANIGRKPTQKTIDAIKKANTGRSKTKQELDKISKIIIDINTGVFYIGTQEVCDLYGYNKRTLMTYLNGTLPNKTPFRYALEDGYKEVNTQPKEFRRDREHNGSSKLVLDLQTGIFYECIKNAAEAKDISQARVYQQLRGKNKNVIDLIYA